ncbi:unnamed protein product, partial [marine sediment metagenome]
MPKSGYKFPPESARKCPICGKALKSTPGLIGHLLFQHGIKSAPGEINALENTSVGNEVPQLKTEVERLRLEKQRDELKAGKVEDPIDVSQQAGLGSLTPISKDALQTRAFNLQDHPQSGLLETLLKNPTALKVVLDGLREGLGLGKPAADPTANLLSLTGFSSLRELFSALQAPKMNTGMIEGVSLAGASLSP